MKAPRTLQEAISYFSDSQRAFKYATKLRWPKGKVICPRCSSEKNYFIKTRRLWLCRGCNKQFTLKVGTIFEDSPLGLDKWMTGFWMLVNCKNGVSSMEIHRALGITQKSAWLMLRRLRAALHDRTPGSTSKLSGPDTEIEGDETFIGGLAKNLHTDRKLRFVQQGGMYGGKTVVQRMLDRKSRQERTQVVPNVTRETLQKVLLKNARQGSQVYTNDAIGYDKIGYNFVPDVVNHAERYVNGRVHTYGLENLWSLLKRGLRGTYVAVEPFHLHCYIEEQVFRYNNRKHSDKSPMTNAERFTLAMRQVGGRRRTYSDLKGKDESPRHVPTGTGEELQEHF